MQNKIKVKIDTGQKDLIMFTSCLKDEMTNLVNIQFIRLDCNSAVKHLKYLVIQRLRIILGLKLKYLKYDYEKISKRKISKIQRVNENMRYRIRFLREAIIVSTDQISLVLFSQFRVLILMFTDL